MADHPAPEFRTTGERRLIGTMAVYDSHAEATQAIPQQWRAFRAKHPELGNNAGFCGASPCTDDRKLHYLTGIPADGRESPLGEEHLTLEAGEYAVVSSADPATLRENWVWLLRTWLPGSGRREKHAPELERFTEIGEDGSPLGPVEIWIPLEPVDRAG